MADLWSSLAEWFNSFLGIPPSVLVRLAETVGLLLLYVVVQRLLRWLIDRRVPEAHRKFLLRKAVGFVLGLLTVLLLVVIWLGGLSEIATYIGVVSAGIAIALRDPLVNLAGWLFLSIRHPFVVGDRIKIGDHIGDVTDRRLFQFTIVEVGAWVDADQSTGRVIHIPNGWIFQQSITNYTQAFPYLWDEVPVRITFESDWEGAKGILLEIAKRHTAIPSDEEAERVQRQAELSNIVFAHLRPIVWTSVIDSGVLLTLRYICGPRQRRVTESAIWEDVLRAFGEADEISFAYPTTRFYDRAAEGLSSSERSSSGSSTATGAQRSRSATK